MAGGLLLLAGALVVWQRGTDAAPRGGGKTDNTGKGASDGGRGGRGGAVPIVAVESRLGNIGVYFNGLGTVTPIYTVTVHTRVDGELTKIYYREGDMVPAGAPLVEIDPRPFQVQLEQAQGQLARDEALLNNARIDLQRYQKLLQQNAIQEQLYATQIATVGQLEGEVKTDKGAVDAAKLNIIYCHITSPIAGRLGLRLVDPGNIVHAADATGLLVITQINPISVLFTIAEDQLQEVMRRFVAHEHLRAYAYGRADQTLIGQGTLTTIDNQIDPSTGTLRLRATFDNRTGKLFPNQFVNMRLLVQEKHGVVLVPTAVVQRTTNKVFVWVVQPDSTVTVRPITEGVIEGDVTEVTSGLKPGEVVVLMGVDKLEEGTQVRVQMENEEAGGGRRGTGRSQKNAGMTGRGPKGQQAGDPASGPSGTTAVQGTPNPSGRGGSQR